jgi:hypothetical protein
MKSFERHSNSFIIRIWQEPREIEGTNPEWRGRVEHMQSGERAYFRDTTKMVEFIMSHLDDWSESPPLAVKGKRGVLRRLLRRLLPKAAGTQR